MNSSRFESRHCYLREKEISIKLIRIPKWGNKEEPAEEAFGGCLDKEIPACCDFGCKYASLNRGVDPFEKPIGNILES